MKKIINHKLYDTDTAALIAADRHNMTDRAKYHEEVLYHTRKGAWFMLRRGGALSIFGGRDGNDRVPTCCIEPITEKAARDFCLAHGEANDYQKYFGELEEA